MVVKSDLAYTFIQSCSGIGADDRDVALTIDNDNREIRSLENVSILLEFLTLLGLNFVKIGLGYRSIWQVGLQDAVIAGSLVHSLICLLLLFGAVTYFDDMCSIAILLNSDLFPVCGRVNLSSIGMLGEKTSVLILDSANIVFADHHFGAGYCVDFSGTWDLVKIDQDCIFV